MTRLGPLDGRQFDVIVVGGGIIGCGVARDAALRGLSVALVEKQDFGAGTTSASTRIVHGGLRYLEMLDFRLVRMDLRERETLLRIAPHLVQPLEFVIPFFPGDWTTAARMRVGLALYDALSFDKSLPPRRWLSGDRARGLEPALGASSLRSAAAYHDARVDSPERLALENVLDAEAHGASAVNYCEVTRATFADGRMTGVRVRDCLSGDECDVAGRVVVNATGPWFDPMSAALEGKAANRIRTTKGVHAVVPYPLAHALVLFSRVDGRLLFAIPRQGLTWLGTTDTDYQGDPAAAVATTEDVDYLIASVRHVFPQASRKDVLFTTAGVRALVRQGGSESSVSRMHKIVDHGAGGTVSILGGKITGYRAIAEDATDAVCRRLGVSRQSTTAAEPLPGAKSVNTAPPSGGAAPAPHLQARYGARAWEVAALAASAPELAAPLSARHAETGAEAVFAVREEHCVTLADFMKRRTLLSATPDQGCEAAAAAAEHLARELGWPEARASRELASYRAEIAAARSFQAPE